MVLGSPYGAPRILLDCRGGDAAASSGPGCLQGVLKLRGGVGSGVEVGGAGGGAGGGGNDDNAGVGVNKQGGEEEDSDMSGFVSTIFLSDDSEGKGFDDALPQVQHATPKIYSIKYLPTNVDTQKILTKFTTVFPAREKPTERNTKQELGLVSSLSSLQVLPVSDIESKSIDRDFLTMAQVLSLSHLPICPSPNRPFSVSPCLPPRLPSTLSLPLFPHLPSPISLSLSLSLSPQRSSPNLQYAGRQPPSPERRPCHHPKGSHRAAVPPHGASRDDRHESDFGAEGKGDYVEAQKEAGRQRGRVSY